MIGRGRPWRHPAGVVIGRAPPAHRDGGMPAGVPMAGSRRQVLRVAAALTAALAAQRGAAAPAKLSQPAAHYQATAKYGESCAMCQLFRPPHACRIVAGDISPDGWCAFFSLPD
jgi:hypothetical protein